MKKIHKIQKIVITSLCSCVVFCGVLYNVGATDSGKETEISTEYIDMQVEDFQEAVNISMDELEKVNISAGDNTQECGTYLDKNGNLYKTSKYGVINSFIIPMYDADENKFISEDVAAEIAEECLELIVNKDNYKLINVAFYNDMNYYRIEYCYFIDEYQTTDRMYFEIASDGKVIGYNAVDAGKYNNVSVELREKDVIMEEALEKIKSENDAYTNFKLNEPVINLEDSIPYYNVSANCTDKETDEFSIVSTKIY